MYITLADMDAFLSDNTAFFFSLSKSQQERSVALETSAYYKFLNTYFSLRAKCWLRGGVGRQFPGTSYNDLPFNIVKLSKAIKRQRTAEYKVLQFSRIFTTIFKTQRWVVFFCLPHVLANKNIIK